MAYDFRVLPIVVAGPYRCMGTLHSLWGRHRLLELPVKLRSTCSIDSVDELQHLQASEDALGNFLLPGISIPRRIFIFSIPARAISLTCSDVFSDALAMFWRRWTPPALFLAVAGLASTKAAWFRQ